MDLSAQLTVWGVLTLTPFVIDSMRRTDLSRDLIRYLCSHDSRKNCIFSIVVCAYVCV
jgi:hypothetical protein